MGIALSEAALSLLDGRNYAVLATVNPDGSPQTSVMWVGHDGVAVRVVVEKAAGSAS
jgi:general stress protein 26